MADWHKWMADNDLTPVQKKAERFIKKNSKNEEVTKAQNGHGEFDLYGDLNKNGDHVQTADNYVRWCIEKGYIPEFSEFAGHDRYFKHLYDFSVYNVNTGATTLQKPVSLKKMHELGADSLKS